MLFSCDYSYLIFSGYSYFLISSILDSYLSMSIPFSAEMRWVLSKLFLFRVCRWKGKSLEAIQVWVEAVLLGIVSTLLEPSPVIFFFNWMLNILYVWIFFGLVWFLGIWVRIYFFSFRYLGLDFFFFYLFLF